VSVLSHLESLGLDAEEPIQQRISLAGLEGLTGSPAEFIEHCQLSRFPSRFARLQAALFSLFFRESQSAKLSCLVVHLVHHPLLTQLS
jgi:hypothetical protein